MFSYNDIHGTVYFDKVLDVIRGMAPSSSPLLQKITGKDGAYFFGVDTDVMEFEIKVLVKGKTRADLWTKIRKANGWLKKKELKKLVFDDEPDLYYEAICVDALDIDEILEFGIGTIKFLAPDPYAVGQSKSQRVSSPAAIFERNGIRYRDNGTEVTEHFPVYKNGKFNEAVLIEEGTTNLLTSASTPAIEEKTVTIGDDYYLSLVGGSATIEHKKVEAITKTTLDKEGTNVSFTKNNFVTGGTHSNTSTNGLNNLVLGTTGTQTNINHTLNTDFSGTNINTEVVGNSIRLKKQGTDMSVTETLNAEFAQGTRSSRVILSGDNVKLDTPQWEFSDNMSSWTTNWTGYDASTNGLISQQSGFTRINVTTNQAVPTGMQYQNALIAFASTISFRAKVTGTVRCILENGANYIYTTLTPSASYAWYHIRFTNTTTVSQYLNGTLQSSAVTGTGTSAIKRVMLFVPQSATGSLDIDQFYADWGFDKGAPAANNLWTGTYTSKGYNLTSLGALGSKTVSQNTVNTTVDGTGTITVTTETGTINPDTSITWSGSDTITPGTTTINKAIRYIVTFTTNDPGGDLQLQDCTMSFISGLFQSGTYESQPIDISSVRRAGNTSSVWAVSNEEFGDPTVDFALSTNGGSSYGAWTAGIWFGAIPGITNSTDLRNARLKYRVNFTSSSVTQTSSFDDISLSLTSNTYKPSGSYTLDPINIAAVGKAGTFYQDWLNTLPTNTTLAVLSRLSLDGGSTWSSYVSSSNGGAINGITQSTNLSNARLQYRFDLATTDDFVTPLVSFFESVLTSGYLPSQTVSITPTNVSNIGLTSDSVMTWSQTTPTNTAILVEYSLNGSTYVPVTSGTDFLNLGENLTGKTLYLKYTLSTSDTNVTPTIGSTLTWLIQQSEPNKIKPVTTKIVLTPTLVSRWQLEHKKYGTGWQVYGTARNDESLKINIHELVTDGLNSGTIDLFLYEEGENYQDRFIMSTDDNTYRLAVKRDSLGNYKVYLNGSEQMSFPAPVIGWFHLGLTWQGSNAKIYIDGVEMDSTTLGSNINLGAARYLYLGCDHNKQNQWNGVLDDVVISYDEKPSSYFEKRLVATEGYNSTIESEVFPFDNSLGALNDNTIDYMGTAESYPIFTVEFVSNASYFRVSNGADYVQINKNFVAGDKLIIDCGAEKATYNTSIPLAMVAIDLDSDFFSVKYGDSIIAEPSGVALVDIEYKERWV
ncbi:putative phage tail component, N-terminal domain-containing protein [Seinonella peptonophila]|uniref:Putative phage tail component, N-terminal domain-containing protein n=1 Tax=Seinonella peptonophila TaxID=112248 RepID=A0A1M4VAQ4_9BACL|nr:distal tail protein Dit [Seinonella peptonophila]SHE66056.1 putative phage tail component, N-terminal domain-containing protein [Seinonella peptonophila]